MNLKLKKPTEIIFLGYHKVLEDYIKINNKFKIQTKILMSKNQKKICKLRIKTKFFSSQNKRFYSELSNICRMSNIKLFISISWPWIISENLIKKYFTNNVLLNIHHSRLPYDAGRATTSWKILRNDRINSTIIHCINSSAIDNGDIIFRKDSLFSRNCKIPLDFDFEINKQSIQMYGNFIKKLVNNGDFLTQAQSPYIGRYNKALDTKKNAWIDWSWSSENLIRFINAFDDPYEGAKTNINNQIVRIKKAQLHGGETASHPFMSGTIIRNDKTWIVVATSDHNCLLIEIVLNKNNKNIVAMLKAGNNFFTGIEQLNLSKIKSKLKL